MGCAELAPLQRDGRRSAVARRRRAACAAWVSAGCSSTRCATRRAWPASGRSARSRTTRLSSSGSASRSCRTPGCPRRSPPTARAARCSGGAGSRPCACACDELAEPRGRGARMSVSGDPGRHHGRRGVPGRRASRRASRRPARSTSTLIVADRPASVAARLHDEPGAGGAGAGVARARRRQRRHGAGRDRQQRLRQRLHGRARAWRRRARRSPRSPSGAGLPARAGAGRRPPASSACTSGRQDRSRASTAAFAALSPRRRTRPRAAS